VRYSGIGDEKGRCLLETHLILKSVALVSTVIDEDVCEEGCVEWIDGGDGGDGKENTRET
jgi:hypothetical protein